MYEKYKLIFVKKLKDGCDIKNIEFEELVENEANRKLENIIDEYYRNEYILISFKRI